MTTDTEAADTFSSVAGIDMFSNGDSDIDKEGIFDNNGSLDDTANEENSSTEETDNERMSLYVGEVRYFHIPQISDAITFNVISDNSNAVTSRVIEVTPDGLGVCSVLALDEGAANVEIGYYSEGVFRVLKAFSVTVLQNKIHTAYFTEPKDDKTPLEINEGKVYNCKLSVYSDAVVDKSRIEISSDKKEIADAELISCLDRGYYTLVNIKVNAISRGNANIFVSDMESNVIIAELPVIVCGDFDESNKDERQDTALGESPSVTAPTTPDTTEGVAVAEQLKNPDVNSEEGSEDYVLNTKSMKFHYPSCRGVSTMKNINREDFIGSRQELVSRGYSPCGICTP